MFWKKPDEASKRLKQMNDILKKSFANVKRDTTNIFQWLNHFQRKSMEQEHLIKRLQLEFSYMPKTREEIRRIIDDYYPFESIMSKIRDIDNRVNSLAQRQEKAAYTQRPIIEEPKEVHVDLSRIEKRLDMLEQKKTSMKEKIIKRLTRNSKEYVKSVILSYIRKYGKVSALQLKEIVVDEQDFCSKSSFYRLLGEIGELDDIGVIKSGKEKSYIAKPMKQIQ